MELRPSGVHIVIVLFLAALGFQCVQPTLYGDKKCQNDDCCTLGVTDCQLLLVNCSAEDGYYEKHDQLSWLNINSSCDFIPGPFLSYEVSHVLYIENYTNTYSDDAEFSILTITVWSSPSDDLSSPPKLLRSYMLNQTDYTAADLTDVVLMLDSLSSSTLKGLGSTPQELHEALESINETLPPSLRHAIASAPPEDRHIELPCGARLSMKCTCHHCVTKTTFEPDAADNVLPSKKRIADWYYTTNVGIYSESIVVSSMLSPFHEPEENPLDDWPLGVAGGWAPSSNDTGMMMTFQSLTTTVCGVVIQGMASSTYRSLDLFSVSTGASVANYSSGMLLDSKSFHYFQQPVRASESVTLRVLQPEDPTRVGFRAGLVACDSEPPQHLDSSVCNFADEVEELFENLTRFALVDNTNSTSEVEEEEDPTAVAVAVYEAIVEIVNSINVPRQEFKITHQSNESEISVQGIESEKLQMAGFTFTAQSLPGWGESPPDSGGGGGSSGSTGGGNGGDGGGTGGTDSGGDGGTNGGGNEGTDEGGNRDGVGEGNGGEGQPYTAPVSIAIPLAAFGKLPVAPPGEPTAIILVVVAVSLVSEEARDVQLGEGSSKETTIASPIITLNVFTNGVHFRIKQMEYSVLAVKKENETRELKPVCAFFEESSNDRQWNTTGCHVQSYDNETSAVSCFCDHTTSYAVLFQVSESKAPQDLASILSTVGLSVSIAALTMALLIYFLVRDQIMAARYVIHSNLMGALLIFAILFVSGVVETDDVLWCTVLKFVFQYLIIATFCWMLAEGIHLYQRIIAVFESGKKNNWIYFLVGWGLPLVFVAIAAGLTQMPNPVIELSTEEGGECVFSYVDNSVWFVLGPVMLIVVVNLVILICITVVVFRAVGFQAEMGASDKLKQAKAALRSALLLTPLLGSTFIIAPFTHFHVSLEMLFIVVNSLQGLFIALFYCALNTEIRTTITERIRRSKEASSIEGSTSGTKVKKTFGELTKSKGFPSRNKVSPETGITGDE